MKLLEKNKWFGGTVLLATCLALPGLAETPEVPAPPAVQAPLAELWVRTSAEYRALCYQTYNAASEQLKNWANLMERRPDGRLYLKTSQKPVAIILDLDETVIDNSPYQAYTARRGKSFSEGLWAAWTEFQALNERTSMAVPGAVEFLAQAKEMGITPIYITNRGVGQEEATTRVLKNIGICTDNIDQRLLHRLPSKEEKERGRNVSRKLGLQDDQLEARKIRDGEGRKEARRRLIQEKYDVLAYFGDVLGDFEPYLPEGQTISHSDRRLEADRKKQHWGRNWFILPNPMYGPWAPGAAIPRDKVNEALDDYGFEKFLKEKNFQD